MTVLPQRNVTEGVPYRALLALAVIFVLGSSLYADERAISVTGSGEAMATPDLMEIELHAAGEAELMADGATSRSETRLVSSTLEDIPVRVTLRVRFALEEKAATQ